MSMGRVLNSCNWIPRPCHSQLKQLPLGFGDSTMLSYQDKADNKEVLEVCNCQVTLEPVEG